MPAQRRKRLVRYKSKRKKNLGIKTPLVILVLIVFSLAYLLINSEFRTKTDKLSVAINKENGDIQISTFDAGVEEITNLIIPGKTEVEVARQLGTLQIKNVWQLGINEGLRGQLLAETLTRHFRFPVYIWADSQATGLSSPNLTSLLKAVLLPYRTNLKIGDRVRMAIFSLGVHSSKNIDINLADTSYIAKKRLVSGEEGYIISGSFPDKLLVVFSDPQIAKEGTTLVIKDATSKIGLAEDLGGVIEVLGAKVVSIDKDEESEFDCEVKGKNREIVERVAKLFSCQVSKEDYEGVIGLEMRIGTLFAKRY